MRSKQLRPASIEEKDGHALQAFFKVAVKVWDFAQYVDESVVAVSLEVSMKRSIGHELMPFLEVIMR